MANLSLLLLLVLPRALEGLCLNLSSPLVEILWADGPYLLTVAVGTINLWKSTETIISASRIL